jgi:hypothetical protein
MDDLFGDVPQPEEKRIAETRKPLTADDVRRMMVELIERVRSAEAIPFDESELEKHVAMFPIMAQWLPDDEGKQLCFEFALEVERLKKAA